MSFMGGRDPYGERNGPEMELTKEQLFDIKTVVKQKAFAIVDYDEWVE